jgi:hypothetical protein
MLNKKQVGRNVRQGWGRSPGWPANGITPRTERFPELSGLAKIKLICGCRVVRVIKAFIYIPSE